MEISAASYGKGGVRVLMCTDGGGPSLHNGGPDPADGSGDADGSDGSDGSDSVVELTLAIAVEGAFLESYRSGDNRAVLPSDTLRRHALAACAEVSGEIHVDGLVEAIAHRILAANPAIALVTVSADSHAWSPHGRHTLIGGGWSATAAVTATRAAVAHTGGAHGVQVLLTTGSAFTGFMRDASTIQTDAADRPLSGTLGATWTFAPGLDGTGRPPAGLVVDAVLTALADRPSNSVQQWLTTAGGVVLDAMPRLATIGLRFESIPIATIQGDAAHAGGPRCFELAAAPTGLTEVTLARS